MNISEIVIAILTVGGVGFLISIFLSFFSNKFKVEVDEKQVEVLEALPGNNCGGCGFAGCEALSKAIVSFEAEVNACPVGGAKVAAKISEIMGVDAGDAVKKVAYVKCSGTCDVAKNKYEYYGVKDCKMAVLAPGKGDKACEYGCLGYGSCVKVCEYGAISIVDGIAKIDPEKCVSCGKCTKECPKNLIEIIPDDSKYVVSCSSKDKGPDVIKVCSTGCIGCGLCARNCPVGAVTIKDFVAYIDQEKCTACGTCVEKCPKKIIHIRK